jgi:hypothetical protein
MATASVSDSASAPAAASAADDSAAASSTPAAPMLDADGKPLSKQAQKKALKAAQLAAEKAAKAAKRGDEKAAQDKERLEKAKSVHIEEDKSLPAAKRVGDTQTDRWADRQRKSGKTECGTSFDSGLIADFVDLPLSLLSSLSLLSLSFLLSLPRSRLARFASTPTSA